MSGHLDQLASYADFKLSQTVFLADVTPGFAVVSACTTYDPASC